MTPYFEWDVPEDIEAPDARELRCYLADRSRIEFERETEELRPLFASGDPIDDLEDYDDRADN